MYIYIRVRIYCVLDNQTLEMVHFFIVFLALWNTFLSNKGTGPWGGDIWRLKESIVLSCPTLHTEVHFGPDSHLPKLPFWTQFRPIRQIHKTFKNVSVHVSL